MSDVRALAARRLAAQRRQARRLVEAEEKEEIEQGGAGDHTEVEIIGRSIDIDDSSSTGPSSASAIRSAHDERRAINQLIYGRLNEVQHGEEFMPTSFVSSRSSKRKQMDAMAETTGTGGNRRVQRVEDFMDEEDRSAGRASVSGSGIVARADFSSALKSSHGPSTIVPERIAAARDSSLIAAKLLKAMGWRPGQEPTWGRTKMKQKQKVYGPQLPPTMSMAGVDNESQGAIEGESEGGVSLSDLQAINSLLESELSEEEVTLYSSTHKDDTRGLGFVPSRLTASTPSALHSHDQLLTFVRARTGQDEMKELAKQYSIEVPDSFDGKHRWEDEDEEEDEEEEGEKAQERHHPASNGRSLVHAWRGQMDAIRRAHAPAAHAATTAVSHTSGTPAAPVPSSGSGAVGDFRIDPTRPQAWMDTPIEALQKTQQAHHHDAPTPTTAAAADIDMKALISAATVAAASKKSELEREQRRSERRSRWGPLRSDAAPPHQPPTHTANAYSVATAFLSANFQHPARSSQPETPYAGSTEFPAPTAPTHRPINHIHPSRLGMVPTSHTPSHTHLPQQEVTSSNLPIPPLPPSQQSHQLTSPSAHHQAPVPVEQSPHQPPTSSSLLAALFPKFVVAGEHQHTNTPVTTKPTSMETTAADPMMANFVPSSSSASVSTPNLSAEATTSDSTAISASTQQAAASGASSMLFNSDAHAAARMKMFGRLTRTKESWNPHPLLYKRFGLPQPSAMRMATQMNMESVRKAKANMKRAGTEGDGVGKSVAGFPSFVQASAPLAPTSINAVGGLLTPTSATSAPTQAAIAALSTMDDLQRKEEEAAIDAQLMNDDYEDRQEQSKDDAMQGDHASMESTVKPPLDLFKAIFENDDEEDDVEGKRREARRRRRLKAAQPQSAASQDKPDASVTTPAPPSKQVVTLFKDASDTGPSLPSTQTVTPTAVSRAAVTMPGKQAAPMSKVGPVQPSRVIESQADAKSQQPIQTSPSLAQPTHQPKREVIDLIDDDDMEDADADAAALQASKQRLVPHGYKSSKLEFVPASSNEQHHRSKQAPSSRRRRQHHGNDDDDDRILRGVTKQNRMKFGSLGSGGIDDDGVDDVYSLPTGQSARTSRQPTMLERITGSHVDDNQQQDEVDEKLPPIQQYVPPPVKQQSRASLPPPIAASWPFPSPMQHAGQQDSTNRPKRLTNSHSMPHSANGATAQPVSTHDHSHPSQPQLQQQQQQPQHSALLSQLLDLHKQAKAREKAEKREKKRVKKEKEGDGASQKESKKQKKRKKHKKEKERNRHHKRYESKLDDSSSDSSRESDSSLSDSAVRSSRDSRHSKSSHRR